jgi:hypothetical protein
VFLADNAVAAEYEAVSRDLYNAVLLTLVASVNDDFAVEFDLA